MNPRVGFVGLSHLGLCSAAAAASKGFATVAFDADSELVARIARGDLPVLEPGLDALVAGSRERLEFTADASRLAVCDLIYIARDVATGDDGRSNLAPVAALIEFAAKAMRPGATLVVLCQVPPGFTRTHSPAGAATVYQVETLVFGRAVERATLPERFIVGLPDPAAPMPPALAAFLSAFGCPILPMRLESAELAKMSINICLASSVTVANTLAEIAERAGADWREIVPALKLDARIGPKAYLDPGLGLSGGNIERDVTALRDLAAASGAQAGLLAAIADNSAHSRNWALRALREALPDAGPGTVVAVLGLAYKQDTHSIKNSAGVALAGHLRGWNLRVHDPRVDAACLNDPAARGFTDPIEAARGADAVAVTTPWAEYRAIEPAALARAMRGRTVVDPYRMLDGAACARAGLRHFCIGQGEARPGDVR
jgi:UDPglucose 6-dehydrogenase